MSRKPRSKFAPHVTLARAKWVHDGKLKYITMTFGWHAEAEEARDLLAGELGCDKTEIHMDSLCRVRNGVLGEIIRL
jgi:2'-5' RNA ligase